MGGSYRGPLREAKESLKEVAKNVRETWVTLNPKA